MKNKGWALLLGVFFGLSANARALTILESETTWTSTWHERWLDADGRYNYVSGAGLLSEPHGWGRAEVGAYPFGLEMSAYASAHGYEMPNGGWAIDHRMFTTAESATRFTAHGRSLEIRLHSWAFWNYADYEQDMEMILRDVTTGATLLRVPRIQELEDPDDSFWGNAGFRDFAVPIYPSHIYELTLSGWTDAFDFKEVRMWSHATFAEVPELTGTLSMLGLGMLSLAVICGMRRFISVR